MASTPAPSAARPALLARWLLITALLVVLIVVVGGITRLTESGVSITEWNPLSGALPPLSSAAWAAEFDAYRQTPQFIQINGPAGMTLADYKVIFWWEWGHRLLARSFGVALALPLAWFWLRGAVPQGYKPRLLLLLALVGLQGAVGWWMVKSGIQYDVRVSHLRLATHLLLALTTFSLLIWTALDLRALAHGAPSARLTLLGGGALAVLAGQIGYGAFVAGLRAGSVAGAGWLNWQAWPLMQGQLVPAGIEWQNGAIHTIISDPYLVHLVHRWWAWVVLALLLSVAAKLRGSGQRPLSGLLLALAACQIALGIATVMSGVSLWLAALHQLTGALLLGATVAAAHTLGRQARTSAAS